MKEEITTKILVAGGRNFEDYELLKKTLDEIVGEFSDVELVSGHARGADTLAEKYAEERDVPIKVFPANWKADWKRAGFIRNTQMIEYIGTENALVVAFWDGESHGTKDTITKAQDRGIEVRVIRWEASNEEI